ncbi:MAG: flavin reductase [Lachnospiraceae bacterium]
MGFREIKTSELSVNPFTAIGKEWMLLTAGDEAGFNTMTASWGAMGEMWGKNAVTTYIRPQRYTKEFVDSNDIFTISFYNESYKKALGICGSISGRDEDKVKKAGLTPYFVDGAAAFEEAETILICRKMYRQYLQPECFVAEENIEKWYPEKDFHEMYISEVIKVLVRE